MAIKVVCPRCKKKMRAPNHLIGRTGRCVACGEKFPITAGSQTDTVEVAVFATEKEAQAPPKPKTAFYQFENKVCRVCGKHSAGDAKVCEVCHNPFPAEKKKAPSTAITLPAADSSDKKRLVVFVVVLIVLVAIFALLILYMR